MTTVEQSSGATAADRPVTAPVAPRRLSPTAAPTGSVLRLLTAQVLAEVRQNLRLPEYLIGVVGVPVLLFTMFGLPQAGTLLPAGTDVGAMIYASMCCYAVVSLTIFTFGVDVAQERGKGWLRRLRVTPMPMWVYFAGKLAMALLFTAAILLMTFAVAVLAGQVRFDPARLAGAWLVLLGGTVAFSTMGFALAFWARPRAASAVGNLVFLPLSFLSGFFYPLAALPAFLQEVAQRLPTYHFGQLVWGQIAPPADVEAFGSLDPGSTMSHVVPVVLCFLVFAVVAALGYRRNAGQQVR